MTPRRSFLSSADVRAIRELRCRGEVLLWRSRASSGERRAALLEGARAAYASASVLVRRARLAAVGAGAGALEVRALLRMQRAAARLKATRAPRAGA